MGLDGCRVSEGFRTLTFRASEISETNSKGQKKSSTSPLSVRKNWRIGAWALKEFGLVGIKNYSDHGL